MTNGCGEAARHVAPRRLSVSSGFANLLLPPFGIDFFDNYAAYPIRSLALAIILFDSGFDTAPELPHRGRAGAATGTVGVLLAAGLIGAAAHLPFRSRLDRGSDARLEGPRLDLLWRQAEDRRLTSRAFIDPPGRWPEPALRWNRSPRAAGSWSMRAGNRDLVVIGGSAGSSGPLKALLSSFPKDLPAAVVVVIHRPSSVAGILPTPSSSAGSIALPVQNAVDGAELRTGHVYLAPPKRHLLIVDGHLKLGTGPRENLARRRLIRSSARRPSRTGRERSGVILSGLLNDGASGLAAVKRCGGIALVQAPSDAGAPDMPLAALEATPVDLSAPRSEISAAVLRFVADAPGVPPGVPRDLLLDVEIAAGGPIGDDKLCAIAEPVAITCPDCGGVLSEIRGDRPLRFRCQVGHGFTGKTLLEHQEGAVDEAMRVALRIIEERAALVAKMGLEARQAGRRSTAEMHEQRAVEYKEQAEILRKAILSSMELSEEPDPGESISKAQVLQSAAAD